MSDINVSTRQTAMATHSVTISAFAASTAIESGVWFSTSAAFWLAPRFRNKHTCLQQKKNNYIHIYIHESKPGVTTKKCAAHSNKVSERNRSRHLSRKKSRTDPVWPRIVAWCKGPLPRLSCWLTLAEFWSRNSQVTRDPWYRHTGINSSHTFKTAFIIHNTSVMWCIS